MTDTGNTLQAQQRNFGGLRLIGGHSALNFLNTVKYRGEYDPQDALASLSDVIRWAEICGLLTDIETRRLFRQAGKTENAERIFRGICAFREDVRLLFVGADSKSAASTRAIARVEAQISALRPVATISKQTGELSRRIVVRTADDLKARIVSVVAELLSSRSTLTIKTCDGFDCDWLFIDRTKARRRRWCDTRTCGNIARVRRFREKHKQASPHL